VWKYTLGLFGAPVSLLWSSLAAFGRRKSVTVLSPVATGGFASCEGSGGAETDGLLGSMVIWI